VNQTDPNNLCPLCELTPLDVVQLQIWQLNRTWGKFLQYRMDGGGGGTPLWASENHGPACTLLVRNLSLSQGLIGWVA